MGVLIMPATQVQAEYFTRRGLGLIRCIKGLAHGLLLSLLVFQSSVIQGEDRPAIEYQVKAAFLYNISGFVSWPEQMPQHNDGFQLCVVGKDPFGKALDTLTGKSVHGQPLNIRRLASGASTENCQLIYISESETGRYTALLEKLGVQPVLTVSDIDDFIKRGGIIRFRLVNNRVRFDININAAERVGLKISSKLLSLANVVREDKVTAR
jgi:hypothetical protein